MSAYIPEPLGLSPVEYVFPLPEYTYLLESGERSVLRGPLRGELQLGNRVTLTLSDVDGSVTRVVRDGKVLSDPPLHAIVWLGGLAVAGGIGGGIGFLHLGRVLRRWAREA